MSDFVLTSIEWVLGVMVAATLAVLCWAPSLYGAAWRIAKDIGFVQRRKN